MTIPRSTCMATVLALACAPAILAQGPAATGDQFQINTYTTDRQSDAKVATSADGGFVIVWTSAGSNDSDSHQTSIQGRRYDAAGAAIGDQFQVNTHTPYNQSAPEVVTLTDGGIAVVWHSGRSSGSDDSYRSIQGRTFGAGGVPDSDDFQVNTITEDDQSVPALAALADGGFVVVWRSWNLPGLQGYRIKGQRYGAGGAPQGGEFQVNVDTPFEQAAPSVAGLSDGGFVAVWTHVDGAGSSIRGRRYDAGGAPMGGEFEVVNDFYPWYPRVTALAGSRFLVMWEDAGFYVDGRLYNADGSPAGEVFRIRPGHADNFAVPKAAATADGGFVVAWHGRGPDQGDYGASIQAQLFAADGSELGGELRINSLTARRQLRPQVTTGPDGDFVVVWESPSTVDPDDFNSNIQGRRFTAPRFALVGTGGKCLDVAGATGDDGTPVNLYSCHGGDNQRWRMDLTGTPQRIVGLADKCLIPGPDGRVVIGECGDPDDLWQLDTVGHALPSLLIHTATGLCLDVEGATSDDGTPTQLFACHGGDNQLWRPAAETCTVDSLGLCLEDERFRAELKWRSFDGTSGTGKAVPVGSDDSGLLWFFEADNWEMLIKVLDACHVNDRYWVFAAATTTVEYTLTITDTALGTAAEYFNPMGNAAAAITDTDAFATCSASSSSAASGAAAEPTGVTTPIVSESDFEPKGSCIRSLTRMCLSDSRFSVEVEWGDYAGNAGSGQVVGTESPDSGLFWFFNSSNWEMLVKVLDACEVNGRFWMLAAATTDVEYTLRVTDTDTGLTRAYFNPLGTAAPALVDTFETCP